MFMTDTPVCCRFAVHPTCYDHGRPQKYFQGGQCRHFAYPLQVSDDAKQMGFKKCNTLSTSQRK